MSEGSLTCAQSSAFAPGAAAAGRTAGMTGTAGVAACAAGLEVEQGIGMAQGQGLEQVGAGVGIEQGGFEGVVRAIRSVVQREVAQGEA